MRHAPHATPPARDDEVEIINFRAVKNWVLFGVQATKRRKRRVFGVALTLLIVAGLLVSVWPKTYRVTCKLLAQKNPALAVRGDDGPTSPTRSVADIILSRENVLNLMKRTQLIEAWKANRPPIMRLKDKLIPPPADDKELIAALADYLTTKIRVDSDDTTVSIQVEWRDPRLAFQLTEAAQNGFLETRHVQEVTAIAEAASILEGHAADVRSQVDTAVAELQRLREKRRDEKLAKAGQEKDAQADQAAKAERERVRAAAPRPSGTAAPVESEEDAAERKRKLSELALMIETDERTITELEGARVRRLGELQGKLQEMRAVYTEDHPVMADTQQAIAAASQVSPQVTKLRGDLARMKSEYERLRQLTGAPPLVTRPGGGGGYAPPPPPAVANLAAPDAAEENDPEISYARSKLTFATQNYQALQGEIHAARISLETAQAAFKYRYVVVNPPEVPKGPVSPKIPLVLIAALIGGLALGIFAAIAQELREGTLYEPWQVEQSVALPVVSTMQLPASARASSPPTK